MQVLEDFCLSIMAGILIGIACYANLLYGGVLGAFLFSFGLIVIVYFKFYLYTGAIGKVLDDNGPKVWELVIFWIGNFLGICFFAVAAGSAIVSTAAVLIVEKYAALGFLRLFGLSIFCGMAVFFAVTGEKNIFKIALCVMIFVLCGFPHCIATMGYIIFANGAWPHFWILIPITIGNSAGALLARLCL